MRLAIAVGLALLAAAPALLAAAGPAPPAVPRSPARSAPAAAPSRPAGSLPGVAAEPAALGPSAPCFDPGRGFDRPLGALVGLGEDGGDHSEYGTRRDGVDWAATRAVVELPIQELLQKLLDPRNLKAMEKTRLVIREREHPDYLSLRRIDVDVRLKALFVGFDVRWTEEWAWRVLEGSRERPQRVLGNYQKVAGTGHIRHQCGSYLLQRLDAERTDLFLYEEIDAKRRSAEDTRDMHRGILRNIREDAYASGHRDERVEEIQVSAW